MRLKDGSHLRHIHPVNTLFVFTLIPLAGHCGQEENWWVNQIL